ncbi:TetR/AcrR family transcriptional regulator [Actinomadura roseirufa]|uniref:TetR/AcrR family transcriptional regulator n=1 Tax=Actinomadura roseirufa TaxID=2094049 RepID=UPI00104132DC|nr:TetR/AcrR family transcriptional regulator [Actinomadura roseirufa]
MPDGKTVRPLRADARDNRRRILAAAQEVLVERGPDVPLEEIARRAGTGIATLYRRFPDRAVLIREVALDALRRTLDVAVQAAEEESDPFAALLRYMHGVLDVRVGAVIPALLERIPLDDREIDAVRAESAAAVQRLIGAAHLSGDLHPDVGFGDIGLLLVRLSRPLPGAIPRDVGDRLAHRHLDLAVNGLRAWPGRPTVAGPALTETGLRSLTDPPDHRV